MSEPLLPGRQSKAVPRLERARETASWGNVSGTERVLRLLAGAAMLAAAWSGAVTGIAGVALQVFGWVPLATGLAGWCPFYAIIGVSTRRPCTRTAARGKRLPPRRSGDGRGTI